MSVSMAPLLLPIRLTEQQRRQLEQQIGRNIAVIPYRTAAPAIRFNFGGITLRIRRGVFTPASLTQQLLDEALRAVASQPQPVIVDVGTGSGAIALAAAATLPASSVYGTEISEAALQCARANRARLGLRNVRFLRGSVLAPLPRRLRQCVHVIAANLPYVPPGHSAGLADAVPQHSAIGTGADGLGLVRELADTARQYLAERGSLVLQLAWSQWRILAPELRRLGYDEPQLTSPTHEGPVVGNLVLARRA